MQVYLPWQPHEQDDERELSVSPVSAGSVIGIGPNVGFPVHTGSLSGGRFLLSPLYSTMLPGQGKRTSTFSLFMQPFTLARNIGGNAGDCLGMWSDEFDGESLATVMGAQFMYISRLPTQLNHVQAKVYFPGAIPSGIAKWSWREWSDSALPFRFQGTFAGHPPS